MAAKKKVGPPSDAATSRVSGSQPMIFISHDDRDGDLAEAWSKLLSSVSAGVLKSFRSSDRKGTQGIEFGVDWYPELMTNLDAASDVVCLLTPRSLDRPWILYEAGVAKGKMGTPVLGIAFGITLSKASTGPFAQFQNCDDSEDSLTKLVMQLLRRIPGSEPDKDAIKMQVVAFKAQADTLLPKLAKTHKTGSAAAAVDDTTVAKLFEEVKIMFQDLPSRVEGRLSDGMEPHRRKRFRRFHPMMLEEFAHLAGRGPGDPIGLLFLVSMFRDDFPPLYELGMEAYRALSSGNVQEGELAMRRLEHLAEVMRHDPMMEEFFGGSKDLHMMLMELPHMLHHMAGRYLDRPRSASRAKKKPTKPRTP